MVQFVQTLKSLILKFADVPFSASFKGHCTDKLSITNGTYTFYLPEDESSGFSPEMDCEFAMNAMEMLKLHHNANIQMQPL
jgi:hypothetical protein